MFCSNTKLARKYLGIRFDILYRVYKNEQSVINKVINLTLNKNKQYVAYLILFPIPSLSSVQKRGYLMGINDENGFLNKNKLINNDKIFSIFLPQKVFCSFVRADIVSHRYHKLISYWWETCLYKYIVIKPSKRFVLFCCIENSKPK